MKIQHLKNIIEEMRAVYKFSDDTADIKMVDDPRMMEHYVEISETDVETGVNVLLHKGIYNE